MLHCKITNIDDVVRIEPIGDAKTYVNGELIEKAKVLHHVSKYNLAFSEFLHTTNWLKVLQNFCFL